MKSNRSGRKQKITAEPARKFCLFLVSMVSKNGENGFQTTDSIEKGETIEGEVAN